MTIGQELAAPARPVEVQIRVYGALVKVVIPGGTGQVGAALGRALRGKGHQVVALSRHAAGEGQILRDGERLGP